MGSVGGPLSVLVLLLPGRGKEFLVPGFCREAVQGAGEKGQFWTDHVKCEQMGRVHIVPYSL